MDSETARQNLVLPGYVHPTNTNTNRNSLYKTFTEGGKKKIKDLDKIPNAIAGKQYATRILVQEEDSCPSCNKKAISTCPCGYSDKKCPQGHVWYTDRDGYKKLGNPH
jgi:hypothetical protein